MEERGYVSPTQEEIDRELGAPLERKDNRRIRYSARICEQCKRVVSKSFDPPVTEGVAYSMIAICPHCGAERGDKRIRLRKGWIYEPLVPDFNGKANHPVPKHHLPPSLKRYAGKVW